MLKLSPIFRSDPFSEPPADLYIPSHVTAAGFAPGNPHEGKAAGPPPSPAMKAGLRYEKQALQYLHGLFAPALLPRPWLFFRTGGHKTHFCQPDALIVRPKSVVVVEVKLRHCTRAWWQLRRLYQPVVQVIYPNCKVRLLEVVRWFDGHEPFPEPWSMVEDPRAISWRHPIGVHIWAPE